ncbi:MAG: hypothetical protein COU51_04075 [Parcubacteria group bacterium CG10_big_fil_rev_8_21_14_0_10_36_14]|nr:MAG: hypothetical protein COU51_04075 [Parcubacteria group bacterium CG10_big_fil_rev_8_21_14_0_10_36_14]
MKKITCAICNDSSSELIYNKGIFKRGEKLVKFNNVICKECGLVYINPRKAPNDVMGFSKENYVASCFALDTEEKIEEYMQHVLEKNKGENINLTFLSKFLKPEYNVLEIGSGFGLFLKDIKNSYGCKTKGIEPATSACYAIAKYGLDIYHGTFEEFYDKERGAEKFDIILMHHVFEHFSEPVQILKKISTFLNLNGFLYIEVPNILNFERRVRHFFDFWHYYNYSPATLSRVLKNGGFKIISRNVKKPSRIQVIATRIESNILELNLENENSYKEIKKYIRKRIISDSFYVIPAYTKKILKFISQRILQKK